MHLGRLQSKFQIICTVVLLVIAAKVLTAGAFDSTSSNFKTQDATPDYFGSVSTSTSFQQIGAGDQAAIGESSSTSFVLQAGAAYTSKFSPASQDWQWFGDVQDETPTTSLAAVNVAPSNVQDGTSLKLRMTIKETQGFGETNVKFKLQFATLSDFSNAQDVAETSSCAGSDFWCYASGAGADGAVISTKVLPDADACSAGAGNGCGTHNTSGVSTSTFTQQKSTATEYEFTLQNAGGLPSMVYFFRAVDVSTGAAVPVNAGGYSSPSLTTGGASLTFSVSGLPQGATTGGIVTGVSTTATSVPFGTLDFASSAAAAQRLTVSTNAAQGYRVLVNEYSPMLNDSGDRIPAVAGTNATPLGWTSGCVSTSTGCYGYHTTAAVLSSGDATRFAADDSYAQFGTSDEVAYSSVPVQNGSTDIIYKIQVSNQQLQGAYQDAISYIVVPTF